MDKSGRSDVLMILNKTSPEINKIIGQQLEDPNAEDVEKIQFESCSFDHTIKNVSTNISKETSIFSNYRRVSFDKCTFSTGFKHLDSIESSNLE